MIIFTNSWKIWLAALAVSLGIFAVIYFTVIEPSNDRADEALEQSDDLIRQSFDQSDEALEQSQQQLEESGQAGGGGGGGGEAANQQIERAQQLTQCIAEAGADAEALQQCQLEFGQP